MRLATALFLAIFMSYANAQGFGSFIGKVVASWNSDGRTMTLVEPFGYIDPSGIRWDAPKGSIIDGASIPEFAWSIIGGPFEGKYRNASVIHDVACAEKKRLWQDVHQAFYTAMLASGVSTTKAKIMYAAVYHFGPRWSVKREILLPSQQSEQRICIASPDVNLACYTVPATKHPVETTIRIDIPAPPETLTREDFERLRQEIESKESSATPMLLEQIQDFK